MTPTPTPDLADRIADTLFGGVTDKQRAAEASRIRVLLAPTLDALAKAQAVIAANDAKELERQGNPFDSPQFELRKRAMDAEEALEKSEAANAVLRAALQEVAERNCTAGILNPSMTMIATEEVAQLAMATNAGQPLLDELALVKSACEAQRETALAQYNRAEAAESRLTTLRQAGERLAEVVEVDLNKFDECVRLLGWDSNRNHDDERAKYTAALAAWREATKDSP